MPDDGPGKRTGTRFSGLVRWGALGLLVPIASIGAAFLFRIDIADAVVRHLVVKAGFPEPEFSIERLDLDGLSVTRISAGEWGSVDRLDLDYSLNGLLEGRVDRVNIVAPVVDLERLKVRKTGGGGGDFSPDRLPRVDIQRADIRLSQGSFRGDASLHPAKDDSAAVRLSGMADGRFGTVKLSFGGVLRRSADGRWTLSGKAEAAADRLSAGEVAANGLAASLPLSATVAGADASVDFEKGARVALDALAVGDKARGRNLELSLSGRFTPAGGKGVVGLRAEEIAGFGGETRGAQAALPIRLEADPDRLMMMFDSGARLKIQDLKYNEGQIQASGFELGVTGPTTAYLLRKPGQALPLVGLWHELELRLSGISTQTAGTVRLNPGPATFSGEYSPDDGYKGRLKIERAGLASGEAEFQGEDLDIRLSTMQSIMPAMPRHMPSVTVDIGAFHRVRPRSGSYRFESNVTFKPDGGLLLIGANLGVAKGQLLSRIVAVHDLRKKQATGDVIVPDIRLGPGHFWPSGLFPAIEPFTDVGGRVGGRARITWRDGKFGGEAAVRIRNLGGAYQAARLGGVNGTVSLKSLFPPATDGFQTLRVARIDAGATLTDASVKFALSPAGILSIDPAVAAIAGGRIELTGRNMDLASEQADIEIAIDGVRFSEVPGLTALQEFDATGRIDGRIPVRIEGVRTTIKGGYLKSREGGVLRLRSEGVNRALSAGGPQVALMLKALENFSYETLSAGIEKSSDGAATVTLQTLGNNPAVANGRKFDINLNLETNLDRLLAVAADWYRLSGRVLKDIVGKEKSGGITR